MYSKGELVAIYKTNFVMKHNYNWSITELEDMTPYEREIYTLMLLEQINKENKQLQRI